MSETGSVSGESKAKVLIVEDERAMQVALNDGFFSEGYEVWLASDGQQALTMARQKKPDLMILDVMLPIMNGLDVCRTLRAEENATPIIMLTARGQEIDKVLGLKLGADDYVTKPFSMAELLARAEALRRRAVQAPSNVKPEMDTYAFGDVQVDFLHHEASMAGQSLKFSSKEFLLLRYFVEHRGEVISRDELLDAVWGYQCFPFTRTVDTHVAKLRKKIESNPADPKFLITVHRLGYKFIG